MKASHATTPESLVLRLSQVAALLGLSKRSIRGKTNPRDKMYDPSFPRPLRLTKGAPAWLREEIESWLKARCAERDQWPHTQTGGAS